VPKRILLCPRSRIETNTDLPLGHGHGKYGSLHDIFYQRARKYAEADEMKGFGEHFITVAHAQAWGVIATYEAKSMLFTRSAMTSARAVRLCQMMGLHCIDGPQGQIASTLMPPADWAELEERRRAWWGAFCFDSHCSLATGVGAHVHLRPRDWQKC
jgi:hypothetical protein